MNENMNKINPDESNAAAIDGSTKDETIYAFVNQKIFSISHLWETQESAARSILARMRRGVGKHPGSTPELWEMTLDGLPEQFAGKGRMIKPTHGEFAVYTALTLFALHQQGYNANKELMSKNKFDFGRAARRIAENDEDLKRIKRRFDAAVTSESMEEISNHLRGLVQLLRSKKIPMDYPQLAEDLFWFFDVRHRDDVRLKWGRDFYRYREENENDQ